MSELTNMDVDISYHQECVQNTDGTSLSLLFSCRLFDNSLLLRIVFSVY